MSDHDPKSAANARSATNAAPRQPEGPPQCPRHNGALRGEFFACGCPYITAPKSEPEGPQDLSDAEWNMLPALLKAADDLCFDCDGVLGTKAPRREIYNLAFAAIKSAQERNLIPRMLAHRAQPAVSRADDEALRKAAEWAIADWERRHSIGARGNIVEQEPEAIRRFRAALAMPAEAEPSSDAPLDALRRALEGLAEAWRNRSFLARTAADNYKQDGNEIWQAESAQEAKSFAECAASLTAALAVAPRDRDDIQKDMQAAEFWAFSAVLSAVGEVYRQCQDNQLYVEGAGAAHGSLKFLSELRAKYGPAHPNLAKLPSRGQTPAAPRDRSEQPVSLGLAEAAQKYRDAERHPQLEGLADALESLKTAALAAPLVAPVARLDERLGVVSLALHDLQAAVKEHGWTCATDTGGEGHFNAAGTFNEDNCPMCLDVEAEADAGLKPSPEKQSPAPAASPDASREAMEAAAHALSDIACNECGHTPDDPFEPDVENGETHCADWLAAYEKVCGVLGWTKKELIAGEWVSIPDKPKPSPAASLEVEALRILDALECYALHSPDCDSLLNSPEVVKPCSCGLTGLFDSIRKLAVLRKAGRHE